MIDTHCHIDLFPNPHKVAEYSERNNITTIGVTNLPSHFEMGFPHVQKYRKVRLAIGLHPLYAEKHESEYAVFEKNIDRTSYIGEIGLDFSRDGISTKEQQIKSFRFILNLLSSRKKFITIHSRRAESTVLDLLQEYKISIAVFHWYSGSIKTLKQIIDKGYFLSVNPAMTKSKAGQKIIKEIPKHLLLTESDGPFIEIEGRKSTPKDIHLVLNYLSTCWNLPYIEVHDQVQSNFLKIIEIIRS